MTYHNPVLLHDAIEGLKIKPGGVYVDLTFGGGGHSQAIIEKLTSGKLIAFDRDRDAENNFFNDSRFIPIQANFKHLTRFLRYHNAIPIDGLLADLGISSHQIDDAERGFTFRTEAPLDFRMNRSQETTAEELLNTLEQQDITDILRQYGEVDNAFRVAKAIVDARPLSSTTDLVDALWSQLPRGKENKALAKIFQAVRIAVNHELEALESVLMQLPALVGKSGRIVFISYNSLEDRLVKNFIKAGNLKGEIQKDFYGNILAPFTAINKKVIVPGEAEIQDNPRARSAKMRIAERN